MPRAGVWPITHCSAQLPPIHEAVLLAAQGVELSAQANQNLQIPTRAASPTEQHARNGMRVLQTVLAANEDNEIRMDCVSQFRNKAQTSICRAKLNRHSNQVITRQTPLVSNPPSVILHEAEEKSVRD